MAQLKHFLNGLSCRYLGRTSRRAAIAAALLAGDPTERRRKHLQHCAACRARQQRERQYLERLRGAGVPAASDDLTARLLARTGDLAAGQEDNRPAPRPVSVPAATHSGAVHRAPTVRRSSLRVAVGIGGGMAAAAVLLGGAAYLLGAELRPSADGAFAPASSATFPGRLTGAGLPAEGISGSGWKLSGEPDVAPAASLSAEELSALRAGGWTCPELHELGYHLVWARTGTAYGVDVLELRLTDGQHFATVLEQHSGARDGAGPAAGATPDAVPVNVLTGHPASEDGFAAAPLDAADQGSAAAPGALWVNKQAPFRAIYRAPAATFTYISDLPEEQAADGMDALVRSRPAASPATQGGNGLQARLERGLQRIAELLAR